MVLVPVSYTHLQVPSVLPRIVRIPSSGDGENGTETVILLEEIIERIDVYKRQSLYCLH